MRKGLKNKYSIVSNTHNNEFGEYTYYCHEDNKGQKNEVRKSKLVPLKGKPTENEEECDDLDSITTPISTSQMKSEFRDRHVQGSRERTYNKIMMQCKSKFLYSSLELQI